VGRRLQPNVVMHKEWFIIWDKRVFFLHPKTNFCFQDEKNFCAHKAACNLINDKTFPIGKVDWKQLQTKANRGSSAGKKSNEKNSYYYRNRGDPNYAKQFQGLSDEEIVQNLLLESKFIYLQGWFSFNSAFPSLVCFSSFFCFFLKGNDYFLVPSTSRDWYLHIVSVKKKTCLCSKKTNCRAVKVLELFQKVYSISQVLRNVIDLLFFFFINHQRHKLPGKRKGATKRKTWAKTYTKVKMKLKIKVKRTWDNLSLWIQTRMFFLNFVRFVLFVLEKSEKCRLCFLTLIEGWDFLTAQYWQGDSKHWKQLLSECGSQGLIPIDRRKQVKV